MPAPTIDKATTAAAGANWTAFSDIGCGMVKIINNSGTTIEYRLNSGPNTVQILSGDNSGFIFDVENASKVSVRRVDVSNTQVDVQMQVYSQR